MKKYSYRFDRFGFTFLDSPDNEIRLTLNPMATAGFVTVNLRLAPIP